MSLVGYQAYTPVHNRYYNSVIADYDLRHSVKPGIIRNENHRSMTTKFNIKDMENQVKQDIEYVDDWSLCLDIKIVFIKLLGFIFHSKNL